MPIPSGAILTVMDLAMTGAADSSNPARAYFTRFSIEPFTPTAFVSNRESLSRAVLTVVLSLAACGSVETRITDVSMKAGDWAILYSYGMPARPTTAKEGWFFSFPEGRDNCVSKKDPNCPSERALRHDEVYEFN